MISHLLPFDALYVHHWVRRFHLRFWRDWPIICLCRDLSHLSCIWDLVIWQPFAYHHSTAHLGIGSLLALLWFLGYLRPKCLHRRDWRIFIFRFLLIRVTLLLVSALGLVHWIRLYCVQRLRGNLGSVRPELRRLFRVSLRLRLVFGLLFDIRKRFWLNLVFRSYRRLSAATCTHYIIQLRALKFWARRLPSPSHCAHALKQYQFLLQFPFLRSSLPCLSSGLWSLH